MKLRHWALTPLLATALIACAQQSVPAPTEPTAQPVTAAASSAAQSPPTPQAAPTLRGRLALTVESEPPQSWSAGFALEGDARQGSLQVYSPLGSVISILSWSLEQTVLRAGNKTALYASLNELTQAATGTALPIEALFDWLAGKPTAVEGWQADVSRQAQGRISATRTAPEPRAQLRVVIDAEEKTNR